MNRINRLWLAFVFFLYSFVVTASPSNSDKYYGPFLGHLLYSPHMTSDEVRSHLYNILTGTHVTHSEGAPDMIFTSCTPETCEICTDRHCYRHITRDYRITKRILFDIDINEDGEDFFFRSFYCKYDFHSKDHPSVAPGKIPNSFKLNVEHLWPQSHFSKQQSKKEQKNDLHHLQIVNMRVNSTRGNRRYGEVKEVSKQICEGTFLGKDQSSETIFQPRFENRGNIARSLFYFSIRYQVEISPEEENFLRKWHREDPVDAQERARHEMIAFSQKNRNPFVDYPQLEDKILNFGSSK